MVTYVLNASCSSFFLFSWPCIDKDIIYLLLLFILIEISYIWFSFIVTKYSFLFYFLLFPLYDGTLYSIYWTKVLINQWASKLSWVGFYPNFSCAFFVRILSSFSHGLYTSNMVSDLNRLPHFLSFVVDFLPWPIPMVKIFVVVSLAIVDEAAFLGLVAAILDIVTIVTEPIIPLILVVRPVEFN